MKAHIAFALLSTLFLPSINAQASQEQWYVHVGGSEQSLLMVPTNMLDDAFYSCSQVLVSDTFSAHSQHGSANPQYSQRCRDMLYSWESGPIGVMLESVFFIPATISRTWVPYLASDSNFFKSSSSGANTYYLLGSRSGIPSHKECNSVILMSYNRSILPRIWSRGRWRFLYDYTCRLLRCAFWLQCRTTIILYRYSYSQ